jgi:predicted phosphodiesterase
MEEAMNTTRIVITSDTHNLETVDFWKAIKAEHPDVVLHAGDWTMLGFQEAKEALDRMRQGYKGPLWTVLGNHDFWEPDRGKELPASLIIRNWDLLCQGYNVEILEGTAWKINNIRIGGLSG